MQYLVWSLIFTNVALALSVVHYLRFAARVGKMLDLTVEFAMAQQGFNKETLASFEKLKVN